MLCFRLQLTRFPQCKVIYWICFALTLRTLFRLCSTDDVTIVAIDDFASQLSNEELGVGTSTLLLLSEFQDEIKGTPVETCFFFFCETFLKGNST